MARRKVKLQFITNDTARRVTFFKRAKSLVKKSEEISILCGVDVCTIIHSGYEEGPRIWPPAKEEVTRVLLKYNQTGTNDFDQTKRKFNQKEYLEEAKEKLIRRVERIHKRNIELDMEHHVADMLTGRPVDQVPLTDYKDLMWVLDDKIRSFQHRIMLLEGSLALPYEAHNNVDDDDDDDNNNPSNMDASI